VVFQKVVFGGEFGAAVRGAGRGFNVFGEGTALHGVGSGFYGAEKDEFFSSRLQKEFEYFLGKPEVDVEIFLFGGCVAGIVIPKE